MALVAAHDWKNDMDSRQQRPHINNDPNNPAAAAAALQQQSSSPSPYSQQSYAYAHPHQQQQPGPQWHMPGMNQMNMGQPAPGYFPPMQFYPPYPHPQQGGPPQMHAQMPHQQPSPYGQPPQMFDPNAQFAQWAYQQMLYNAQQTQLAMPPQQQRTRSGSHSGSNAGTPTNEYYQTPFNQNRFQPGSAGGPPQNQVVNNNGNNNYQGFHPYRRPDRTERKPRTDSPSSASSNASTNNNSNTVPFQPPYARADAAGSTTSVNSSSGASHRSRTNSGTSANGSTRPQHTQQKHSSRQPSTSSSQTSSPRNSPSSSSTMSSAASSSPGSSTAVPRTSRPSPLSQGSILSAAERRKSRDDSDLAAMLNSSSLDSGASSGPPMARSGLKGRLRRALSFSTAQTLKEEEEEAAARSSGKKKDDGQGEEDGASMATKKTKKSLRMFNSRFNASTDNISLSSTVSSASVMIRKLGSMGKLARRNSLAGITSLFKDKNKDKENEGSDGEEPKNKKKSKAKGAKAEASVTLATAEVDRSNDWSGSGMEGLSPAAKLARQHTLKSNAEAAARAKAQQEAQAAAAAAAAAASSASPSQNGENMPTTWERNTATRHGVVSGVVREDGMRVVVEEDSDEEGVGMRRSEDQGSISDEDSTWHGHGQDDEDETIRLGSDRGVLEEGGSSNGHDDDDVVAEEPWALNIRRSVERTRQPTKGILKNANSYSQELQPEGPNAAFMQRVRANSYDSVPTQTELGPLARIPSPDPDHIDGLHRHGSHKSSVHPQGKDSTTVGPPTIPPLSFDSPQLLSPATSSSSGTDGANNKQSMFNHPGFNNSEPTLSTISNGAASLGPRSATNPKKLAFAANLSIYDTFSATAYDRRSEPATWSRLTPALAQRIKEELNSFKMEEMEVHAASRIHTQFFV